VPRRIAKLISAAVAALAELALAAPQLAHALAFTPCPQGGDFACASLSVPLDRSGAVAGGVTLAVERLQAGSAPSDTAVVALAGGPGQAAIPAASQLAAAIAPALSGRDLIVFDQRGTGSSGPLACSALEGETGISAIGQAFERCALQIGADRGSYTTQESVADIEALRVAMGYRRLVLFGVSYGTKVALEYAERHPEQVQALVLDSVVPHERDDPFQLATFKAVAPALAELCSRRACAGIASDPLGDLARLSARLKRHALSGHVYDGSGHRRGSAMSDVALLNLLAAGDLNPSLRALLPASVASALRGDPAPLLRLNLLSEGLVPNLPGGPAPAGWQRVRSARAAAGASSVAHPAPTGDGAAPIGGGGAPTNDGVDEALFADTTCEEGAFPWSRSATAAVRVSEALAALHALPASSFYPFDASVEWADSVLPGCAHWPNLAPPPPPAAPLPAVPTLILSGAQDLRTPTSGAEAVAARIPGSSLVVVPFAGHSVLGSDFSGCAQAAVKAFFSAAAVQPCLAGTNQFAPTPIAPTGLSRVTPIGGLSGTPGRTLAAVLDTIVDLERQVVGATLQAQQRLPSGSSFGGLRGGYARIGSSSLHLHRLSFVPGVQLTATFHLAKGKLQPSSVRVQGTLAAAGSVRVGGPIVTGTLGGHRFRLDLAKVRVAATRPPSAQASPPIAQASPPSPPVSPPSAPASLERDLPLPVLLAGG
jgi:pimeloyl-ACP methyl ester carboxylesterase